MKIIRRFLGASPATRQLALEVALLLCAVRLALSILPFRWIHRLILRYNKLASQGDLMTPGARAVVEMVNRASHYVPGASCLTRAITAQILLDRRKIATTLHIGVMKPTRLSNQDREDLLAHAWLEHNGEVIVGDTADRERYVPLPVLSVQRPRT